MMIQSSCPLEDPSTFLPHGLPHGTSELIVSEQSLCVTMLVRSANTWAQVVCDDDIYILSASHIVVYSHDLKKMIVSKQSITMKHPQTPDTKDMVVNRWQKMLNFTAFPVTLQ